MPCKPTFVKLSGLARIIYIYWPIDHTPKPSFEMVFKVGKITYIY
jgi:hypothetical protein